MLVEFREFGWLERKTSSLELAELGWASHRADGLDRLIIAISPEAFELSADHLLIKLDIMSDDDVGGVEVSEYLIHDLLDIRCILDITIVDAMDLRRGKRDRDARSDQDIDTIYLDETINRVNISEDPRELNHIRLLIESSSSYRETGRFCIEDECFHRWIIVWYL
ncbi:MAG: hypothetical protein ACD_78C00300G0006 [uncultured bacterium (gcode 4)]|uniref:Uncharacterized protein n=1 Tax=uncultured bacterium (gcode 4) TaxID=1234023 RepID=K1YWS3_9BACT|nr:MAG: hypothetical protein ACD_78C00300G0006 [uncultured bacterium (gcode 4)]